MNAEPAFFAACSNELSYAAFFVHIVYHDGILFAVSCIIGIVLCCFGGSGSTALDCLLAGADSAVELSISLAGAYLLWMGLINVASEAGLIEKLAARMHKPLRLLMPDAGDASASVTLNLAANFFGLGNAATPFGLDAMKRLNAVNPDKQSASNAICMFLALNASAIELMPTGVIAVRIACGSANAYDIVLPTFISSVFSAAAQFCMQIFRIGSGCERNM